MTEQTHAIDVHARRYSAEVKREAVARVAAGETMRKVAADVGCAYNVLKLWRIAAESGDRTCPFCSKRPPVSADLIAVLKLVIDTADAPPMIRKGVLRIAADAIASRPTTATTSDGGAS